MAKKFQIGDIVIKKSGKKPAEIVYEYSGYESTDGYYHCKYLHSSGSFYAHGTELKFYEEDTEQMAQTKTLYSFTINGNTAYGTHIGTNSQNQYLIEEKGTGKIHVFDKKDLEEVVPYTFSAKMGNSENHYIGTPGSIAKDDILLYTGSSTPQIAVVTAVDTKSKSARSRFNGVKIVTQAI